MIVMQVTLLPQPDSPTIASVSPFSTENEMPSTAPTMPSSVLNEVLRSLTSSSAMAGMVGDAYESRILGSIQAYRRSTTKLAIMTTSEANTTTPSVIG